MMKKNLFYLFALICSMGLLASCGEDDPDYTQVIDTEIAGGYKGELNVKVDATDFGTSYQQITVEKAGATAINLHIKDFSFGVISVGDVDLMNCPLSESVGAYTFTGTTTVKVAAAGLDAAVDAQGSVSDGALSLNLTIQATLGELSQNVAVTFNGTKLSGTEGTGADITAFSFDNESVSEQPVINADNTITFKVLEGADLTKLAPTIEISEGATVTPASGVAQDFSNGRVVTYTVVSEDYGTTKVYKASVAGSQKLLKYSFEDWTTSDTNDTLLPEDLWASSAAGAGILGGTLLKQEANEDGTFAAKLITFEYPNEPSALIPKITAGSIYIGTFDLLSAFTDRLSCTKFGLPTATVGLNGQPVRLKGMYKYQAGETYLDASDHTNVIETEDVDKGSIVAVLYNAKDAEGNDVTLTGHDVNTSENIVGYASVITENTDEYVSFDVELEYKNGYDPEGEYKFAIVCSSSKDGDSFKGAGNSTLIVDELEVICE